MSRIVALLLVASTTACAPDAPAKPEPAAAPPSPTKPAPPKDDPLVAKVCQAYADVAAEDGADPKPMLLARTAARATELGVGEAELAALGSQPSQLLASIRARGNPPGCAALVAYLEKQP